MSDSDSPSISSASKSKSNGAFRTISEVAELLDVPQHVLRFWESKFSQLKPLKRGGGRRYYRPEDVQFLVRVRDLLYDDGYTIKGVQKLLRQSGSVRAFVSEAGEGLNVEAPVAAEHAPISDNGPETAAPPTRDVVAADNTELLAVIDELKALHARITRAIE